MIQIDVHNEFAVHNKLFESIYVEIYITICGRISQSYVRLFVDQLGLC